MYMYYHFMAFLSMLEKGKCVIISRGSYRHAQIQAGKEFFLTVLGLDFGFPHEIKAH